MLPLPAPPSVLAQEWHPPRPALINEYSDKSYLGLNIYMCHIGTLRGTFISCITQSLNQHYEVHKPIPIFQVKKQA